MSTTAATKAPRATAAKRATKSATLSRRRQRDTTLGPKTRSSGRSTAPKPNGTAILVAHINYRGVDGVFSDLADYRVGEIITVALADGRNLKYVVAAPPIEVDKDQVGPRRQELFAQTYSYGLAGGPGLGGCCCLAAAVSSTTAPAITRATSSSTPCPSDPATRRI